MKPSVYTRCLTLVRTHPLAVLVTVVGVMYAFALFNHGLVPSMEPRFAEVIREMMQRGEYLIPIKNGVPYIEYPPLYFWLSLLGHTAGLPISAAIRLPGYIALLCWVVWVARLQRRLYPEWPVWVVSLAGVALPGILYNFFTAQSDSILMLGVLIALTGYCHKPRGFNWELWLGVALATLAKGPVGMAVTLPIIGIDLIVSAYLAAPHRYARWHHFKQQWRLVSPFRGIALVLALNLPWYIAAGFVINWEFVRAVVVYQNFTRFLIGFDHLQPWWYYATTIFYDAFPIAFVLPIALVLGWRKRCDDRWRIPLIWMVWTIVFFSCSQSKQGKYILTAAPAFVLLALATVQCIRSCRWRRWINQALQITSAGILVVFCGLVIFVVPFVWRGMLDYPAYQKLHHIVRTHPAPVFTYRWPKSRLLWEFGAPLQYVRSARQLYQFIQDGRLAPGDYLIAGDRYLPSGFRADSRWVIKPPPAAPYLKKIITVDARGAMTLYRVMAQSGEQPVPKTPEPPPKHWWDAFDTD